MFKPIVYSMREAAGKLL